MEEKEEREGGKGRNEEREKTNRHRCHRSLRHRGLQRPRERKRAMVRSRGLFYGLGSMMIDVCSLPI